MRVAVVVVGGCFCRRICLTRAWLCAPGLPAVSVVGTGGAAGL